MCTSAEKLPEGQCVCEHTFFKREKKDLYKNKVAISSHAS